MDVRSVELIWQKWMGTLVASPLISATSKTSKIAIFFTTWNSWFPITFPFKWYTKSTKRGQSTTTFIQHHWQTKTLSFKNLKCEKCKYLWAYDEKNTKNLTVTIQFTNECDLCSLTATDGHKIYGHEHRMSDPCTSL